MSKVGLPRRIGRFEVLRELGAGGMGVVFLARDPLLGRRVAVKVMRGLREDRRRRFRREAEALARVRHAGVVRVHELGEAHGTPYLVMDYVEGTTLQDYPNRDGRLGEAEATDIVRGVAEALRALHAAGVLHRDLKPSNILLTPRGEPVLIDFGLSSPTEVPSSQRITRPGVLLGSPGFWAPEMIRGESATPATDVYGLAATLYALVTGVPPRTGTLIDQLAQAREPVAAPSSHEPSLSRHLDAVLQRALAADPRQRHANPLELAHDLAQPCQPAGSRSRRRSRLLVVLGLAVAGAICGAGLSLAVSEPARPAHARAE